MIVIDTSALVAVILNQEQRGRILSALLAADSLAISAVTLYETGVVVLSRRGPEAFDELKVLLNALGVAVAVFDSDGATAAIDAYRVYGKGNHPAGLNLGDCPAYSLAKGKGATLLYLGEDFARTDIHPALP
jgi:ribonuclease VapC